MRGKLRPRCRQLHTHSLEDYHPSYRHWQLMHRRTKENVVNVEDAAAKLFSVVKINGGGYWEPGSKE